ncbi:flagellar hook-associated family protein [Microvirga sp. CF3062]|uniref:flagellar hook-associated family protein n=1 Tax=Microvirga sp. CF3062 TaxID=3110182 RepID=UPI002E798A13|nr:flagellar hook-associated family protein [Microvirga sp. CF3062]MEE1655382.1 flagellar hook-associated family protein [Microvirga sp. CF3062]
MRTSFVSTLALWNSSKTSLDKMQTGLVKANKELVTGRDADVGLKLGYKTGQTLSLRQDRAEIDALIDSNASILLRMKSSTTALDQVRTNGDKFMDALIATPLNSSSLTTVMYQARVNLQSMVSSMNSNVGGQYIFGGINSQEKPLNDYSGGTPTLRAAVSIPVSGLSAGDVIRFGVGGTPEQVFTVTGETTVDALVTSINAAVAATTLSGVEASRDPVTGNLVLKSIDLMGKTDVTGSFTDVDGAGIPVEGSVTRSPQAAVASAFRSTFGFGVGDAAVSTITPGDMKTFLDGSFAALFEGSNWQDWSNASSQNIQSKISATEKVEASTNANGQGIQKMAMAYTMISELGLDRLGETTREALVSKALETFSEATTGVKTMQSKLGAVQEKVEEADERMSLQKDILDAKVIHLEAVDPAEAKIRVDRLMTQIQTSYSLTAQLRTMSLINYL